MAHLWVQKSASGEWEAYPLEKGLGAGEDGFPLSLGSVEMAGPGAPVEVIRAEVEGRGNWLVLSRPSIRLMINGRFTPGGIRVLRDRDEVVFEGARLYFSAEERAIIVPFPAAADAGPGRETRCARCKDPIRGDSPAVKCPYCSAWHHQDEGADRPCWTYAATCANCRQTAGFQQEYQWTPATL